MINLSSTLQSRLATACIYFFTTVLSIAFAFCSKAQTYPANFNQVLVASGISNPTVMAFAPDGRIFVAQQNGQLRIIKNGVLLATPFISLSVSSTGERGLLGIAFDPAFNTNHFIYLYYTLASGANNRISRFTANGDVALAGSESVVLNLDPLSSATNHNGGTLAFGPDGKLYVGVGENANGANAQNLDTYLGKVLRINPDGSVPAGNPYTTGSEQRKRVWAYGMRNPYTLTFQPGTGRLFVNDVGQNTWEEINDATTLPATGARNYGWPNAEGVSSNTAYTNPVYAYAHGSGPGLGCAITGGTFFNPTNTNYPASYIGKYFYVDLCGNWMDVLTVNGSTGTAVNFGSAVAGSPVSVVTGNDGNLYFISRSNSAVYKITYTGGTSNAVLNPVADAFVRSGAAATINYGTNKKLQTENATSANSTYQSYIRFDISSVNTTATSIKLRLYGYNNNTNTATANVQVFNVSNNSWGETTINYNNKPAGDATVLASAAVTGTTMQYYEWDLTQHIKTLRNAGATSVSLLLKNQNVTNTTITAFFARESATNKPELSITYPARGTNDNKTPVPEVEPLAPVFSVYPNPAVNSITIQYPDEFKNKKLLITDIAGRSIKTIVLGNTFTQKIMLNDLTTGLYIFYVEADGRKYVQKVMVKK